MIDAPRADRLGRAYFLDDEEAKAEEVAEVTEAENAEAAQEPSVMDTTPWLKEIPITVDSTLLEKGQQQFGIYCSVCHGMNGRGNGLGQSASSVDSTPRLGFRRPTCTRTSLYSDKYPEGKLFSTISNGIRKMPGYAGQIKLRKTAGPSSLMFVHLQKSQNANMDLVPPESEQWLSRKP